MTVVVGLEASEVYCVTAAPIAFLVRRPLKNVVAIDQEGRSGTVAGRSFPVSLLIN
jgi:hypothetical protein